MKKLLLISVLNTCFALSAAAQYQPNYDVYDPCANIMIYKTNYMSWSEISEDANIAFAPFTGTDQQNDEGDKSMYEDFDNIPAGSYRVFLAYEDVNAFDIIGKDLGYVAEVTVEYTSPTERHVYIDIDEGMGYFKDYVPSTCSCNENEEDYNCGCEHNGSPGSYKFCTCEFSGKYFVWNSYCVEDIIDPHYSQFKLILYKKKTDQ